MNVDSLSAQDVVLNGTPASAAPLLPEQLARQVARDGSKDLAPATVRVYLGVLRRAKAILETCLGHGQLTDQTMAAYLTLRFKHGFRVTRTGHVVQDATLQLAPATLALEVSALDSLAHLAGESKISGRLTQNTLKRYRRQGCDHGRGQAPGLKNDEAHSAARIEAGRGGVAALRNAALVATGADAMMRVSELANIQVEHISRSDDGAGTVYVPTSKTDQTGEGATLYLSAATLGHIDAYCDSGNVQSGYLFRRIRRGGHLQPGGLTPPHVRRIIKEVAGRWARANNMTSVPPYRGHSLRVGSAQTLVKAGYSTAQLMQVGRWKSESMVARYTQREAAGNSAMALYHAARESP